MKTKPFSVFRVFRGQLLRACLFCLLSSVSCLPVFAQTLVKNQQMTGTSNQVNSGATLTVVSGATFTLASGSTFNIPDFTLTLAKLANSGGATGDIIYWNGTNWIPLGIGTEGQRLTTLSGVPAWDDPTDAAPTDATYIVQTANGTLSAEQALGSLSTGILKNTTTTGVLSIASPGSDYVAPSSVTTTGITMSTARLLGRTTASTGAIEEIIVSSPLSLSGGALTTTAMTNPMTTTGDMIVGGASGTPTRVAIGTDTYVWTSNGTTAAWAAPAGGSGDVATDTIWDAAGDMVVGTGSNTAARVAIGTSGYIWTSNGTTASWAAPASGGTLTIAKFTPLDNQPPTSSYATISTRNAIAILRFADAASEAAIFVSSIPEGTDLSNGLEVKIHWIATTATSGAVVWNTAFERSNTDLDSDSFATAVAGTSTTNGTSGIITTTTIDHSSSEIDGITAGDPYRLKITRDGTNGSDTMTDVGEIIAVEVRAR